MNALLNNQGYAEEETANKAWAEDTSSFGQRMLMKMGWKAGKGLGKEETGMTSHVKVEKKIDARGLGAAADPLGEGNTKWAEQQQSFTGVLAALNKKYGADSSGESAEKRKKKGKKDSKRARQSEDAGSDDDVKTTGEGVSSDDGGEGVDSANTKKKKSKNSGGEGAGEEEEGERTEEKEGSAAERKAHRAAKRAAKEAKAEAKAQRKKDKDRKLTVRDLSRARFIKSKNINGYSPKDLAAVLGVVRAASSSAASS
jgi:Pin2-interacting protein X1